MDRLAGLPVLSDFAKVVDSAAFVPLPDDWLLGLADVVHSTDSIEAGRYKAVNMAGAAPISAVMNALHTRRIAFSFGGDGCAFAVPACDREAVVDALARTAGFVRDDLKLTLRVALVPLTAVRAAGFDVRAALFAPTAHVAYAMFDGGGIAWGEAEMKEGRYQIPPAPSTMRPDLSGLSCRWQPIRSQRGKMVSIIARPNGAAGDAFRASVRQVLALLGDGGHPVPQKGPPIGLVSPGMRLEALASRGQRPAWRRMASVAAHHLLAVALFATGIRAGAFDPVVYRALASRNADARKFGDGLMVTVDCDAALVERVREALEGASARGVLRYGMFVQDAALMTCIVPSYADHGHFHFIDGAGGGYAAAAKAIH